MQPPPDEAPPIQMLKLAMGHWISQACAVVARLGIADRLGDEPRSSDELAKEVGADADALYRLMRCCASVGVFAEHTGRRFALTALGATLQSTAAGSLRDFLTAVTAAPHWLPWGRLYEAIVEGKPQTVPALGCDLFTFYADHPAEAAPFHRAMGGLSAVVAADVVETFDFSGFASVNDVGGGHGILLATVLECYPRLSGVLFDLPHAIEQARPLFEARRLGARARLVSGDFFEEVPPADVYLLKAILHDWDDASCRRILRNCRARAARGAKLLVVELVICGDGTGTLAPLSDLNMLVMLTGRERREDEYAALLETSGFRLDRVIPTHTPFSIVEASAS
jgi:hypothetical protein